MLIRCESCGKMFDYDKQDGQCPACGAFAARPESAPAPAPAAPESQPPRGIRGLGEAGGRPVSRPAPRPAARRPAAGGSLLWLRVLLAALGVGFFAAAALLGLSGPEAGPLPACATATAGQPVELAGREVVFSQAQVLAGRTAGLPQGWQLYRVRVSAAEWEDWDPDAEAAVSLWAGGGYWGMLEDYDLEQIWPELAGEALASYDLAGWDALEGWLYLAGPADPAAALCLEDQRLDEDYDPHTRAVTMLELDWEEASEA